MAKFEHVGHHLEHEMEAVEDHMRNTVGKLQAQEKQADNRIDELERLVVKNVESSMKKRISALESDMERHIENHAGDVERTLNAKISESVDVAAGMGGSGGDSRSFLLLIFDGIAVYALWQWYFKIRKSHLLCTTLCDMMPTQVERAEPTPPMSGRSRIDLLGTRRNPTTGNPRMPRPLTRTARNAASAA